MKPFLVLSALLLTPSLASAQTLGSVLTTFSNLINTAIPVVIALAVLYFFWGLAQYILNSADEEKKGEGRTIMIYGVIALFVMVSVFGLIRLLQTTFNVQNQTPIIPGEIRR